MKLPVASCQPELLDDLRAGCRPPRCQSVLEHALGVRFRFLDRGDLAGDRHTPFERREIDQTHDGTFTIRFAL